MDTFSINEITTPAALIDLEQLTTNTKYMSKRAHDLGVQLRPHVKTHKCIEAARYQVADHFGGITVSTLAEAHYFANRGFRDITYAVPLALGRVHLAAHANAVIERFQVLIDHEDTLAALEKEMQLRQSSMNVLIKIDCGYGRAGLQPDDPRLLALADAIFRSKTLRFCGVLAHGGHAYDCASPAEIIRVAEEERCQTVKAAAAIRRVGIPVEVVSVGSTPTACLAEHLNGVTELRPGNYTLFDVFQASIGSCDIDAIALSVLTEVIGVYSERGTILIDAGALALSKDAGPDHLNSVTTFGIICDLNLHPIPGLTLYGLSQEHGKIAVDENYQGALPSVGSKLRILPNHSCLVTALYTQLFVVSNQEVVDKWMPIRGW